MNVAEGAAEVSPTVVGLKVPPPPASLGVIVTVPATMVPGGNATVNGVEGTPTVPAEGPVKLYVVALTPVAVYAKLAGSVRPPLFVVPIVFAPVVAGV